MIKNPNFFKIEKEGTLMVRNYGFLTPSTDFTPLLSRTAHWASAAGATPAEIAEAKALLAISLGDSDENAENNEKNTKNSENMAKNIENNAKNDENNAKNDENNDENEAKNAKNDENDTKNDKKNTEIDKNFISSVENDDEEIKRVIAVDAERTFAAAENRALLALVAGIHFTEYRQYQQNISFIVSFMLLFRPPAEVYAVLKRLRTDKQYLPGHFSNESVGSKIDSFLFFRLLSETARFKGVHRHLENNGVPPDFLKKWFSGLCVHILPFEALFEFFDGFLPQGFRFCLKFAFAAFDVLSEKILESGDIEEIMAILEFVPSTFESVDQFKDTAMQILDLAKSDEFDFVDGLDIVAIRSEVFRDEIQEKLDKAKEYAKNHPIETIPSCGICEDGFQDLFCDTCGIAICEECHEDPPESGPHKASHYVEEYESSGNSESDLSSKVKNPLR